jgi:hypothetical protein
MKIFLLSEEIDLTYEQITDFAKILIGKNFVLNYYTYFCNYMEKSVSVFTNKHKKKSLQFGPIPTEYKGK